MSLSSNGSRANSDSAGFAMSSDGRFVAFDSFATNLASGDSPGTRDIFVRDRQTGTTERVNVSSRGAVANDRNSDSGGTASSADGRYVQFFSTAWNLVDEDGNDSRDTFVRDRQVETTTRVSVTSAGAEASRGGSGGSMSAGGRFVVFQSQASNLAPPGAEQFEEHPFVRIRSDIPEVTTTTQATSTTTTTPTAPTTTLPCTGPPCILDASIAGAACAGQTVPTSVTRRFDRAVSLIDEAATSTPEKAKTLRRKARATLKQARTKVARAAKGKKPAISSECAAALRAAAVQVMTQI